MHERSDELDDEQVRPHVDLVDRLGPHVLDRARLDDGEQTLRVATRSGGNRRCGGGNRAGGGRGCHRGRRRFAACGLVAAA